MNLFKLLGEGDINKADSIYTPLESQKEKAIIKGGLHSTGGYMIACECLIMCECVARAYL